MFLRTCWNTRSQLERRERLKEGKDDRLPEDAELDGSLNVVDLKSHFVLIATSGQNSPTTGLYPKI